MGVITYTLTAIAAALVTLAIALLFIASARAEEAPDWAVRIMDETNLQERAPVRVSCE